MSERVDVQALRDELKWLREIDDSEGWLTGMAGWARHKGNTLLDALEAAYKELERYKEVEGVFEAFAEKGRPSDRQRIDELEAENERLRGENALLVAGQQTPNLEGWSGT